MGIMKTNNRYLQQGFMLIAIGVFILSGCGQPSYDVQINVEEINRTSDIRISYKLNNGNETYLGTTNKGTLKSNIQDLKGNYRITILAKRPGYKVDVVSPNFPRGINNKRKVIDVKLRANPNEKKIRITSTPATPGIKTILDDGRGGSASSMTNNSGDGYISLKSVDWSSVKFSFSHPDYYVSSQYENKFIEFNYIPTTIRLSIFPKKELNYNLKIVNLIDGRPIIGAVVSLVGTESNYLSRIDGSVQIPAITSFLVEEEFTIGSELEIAVEKSGYIGMTVKFEVSNEYADPVGPEEIIQLQPANELTIKVHDKGGRALAGIPIEIEGSETKTTDVYGKVLYQYEAKRASEKIMVSISEENILPFQREITLSAINKTETLVVSPYSYYLEVRNKSNHSSIDDVKVIASADVSIAYLGAGMVQLLFKTINKVYTIDVSDSSGNYETVKFELNINGNNLAESSVVDLLPKTFIQFKVKDHNSEPLSGVSILRSNNQIGITNTDGILRKEIAYSADPLSFSVVKSQFKSVNIVKFISPGENSFPVEMTKLELIVTVIDNETKMVIPGVDIKINNTKYTSDSMGQILFNPKSDNSDIILEKSGEKGVYLKSRTMHKFDSNVNSSAKFYIQPRPTIIVKTIFMDPSGMKGKISGVALTIAGKSIGDTDANGSLTIQLDEIGKAFSIRADKKGFISDSIQVPAQRPTIHNTEIILQGITVFVNVFDVSYNKIEGLNVSVDGSHPTKTNNWGQAVIRLSELKKEVTISVSDPKRRYVSKNISHTFNHAKAAIEVKLVPKPVDLTVTVGYSDGSPAIANVEILPPPTNTGETVFGLSEGTVTIPVYKAGTYEVRYTTQGTFITGSDLVRVDLGVEEIRKDFNIPSASMKVRVDSDKVVNVSVYASERSQDFTSLIGTIPADGKTPIDLNGPGYTEYKLVFTRPGWTASTEVVVKLTTPSQLFDLRLGDQYQECKKLESSGDWEKACIECAKVDENDPFFCDAASTLIFIYRDQLNDELSAAYHASQYLNLMNSTCGKNWSYYSIFFELVAKLDQIPTEFTDENRIYEMYSEFKNLAILTISKKSQKNKAIELVDSSCAEITCNRIKALKAEHTKRTGQTLRQAELKQAAQQLNNELREYVQNLPTNLSSYYTNIAASTLAQM
jgi:hypothetical protein